MSPGRWLCVAIVVYFVVSFSLSWLRAIELQTTTWDQGLYQQALWTTAHGRPFYETADVETGGFGSLLDVHSVFILYLLAPVYGVLPYQTTLFAIQSAAVALAAVPLYFLARDVTRSARLSLLASVAFLAWTPTLSSNLYDFHPEAFLPLEIFALVLFWNREQFGRAFAVALVAFLTFEFAAVIVFAVGVFALLPEGSWRRHWAAVRTSVASGMSTALREWWRPIRTRAAVLLLVSSAAAYLALLVLRLDVFPGMFGTYPLPSAASGYLIGASPGALGLAWSNVAIGFGAKVTYWLVILGLLAFVPLLAPRALVLSVPWFLFTMFSSNLNYATLGFQYGLVAGSTLLVAFVYGLPRAARALESWTAADADRVARPSSKVPVAGRSRLSGRVVLVGLVTLLLVNIALSPIDPAMQNAGLGSGYRLSFTPGPGASQVVQLASLVPAGATVLATDDLFPIVANDPNAYSFLWTTDPTLYLPFSLDHPPTYVFVSADRTPAVSSWLGGALYNTSIYGVRGVVWNSPAGTVLLFETGYRGALANYGQPTPLPGVYYGVPLSSRSDGYPTTVNGSTYPKVVQSVPGQIGTVWYGPGISLARGNYTITVSVRLSSIPGFPAPNASTPTLWIGAQAFAEPTYFGWSYPFGTLNTTGFDVVSFGVSILAPTIEFNVQGELLDSSAQATLNYLEVSDAGGST